MYAVKMYCTLSFPNLLRQCLVKLYKINNVGRCYIILGHYYFHFRYINLSLYLIAISSPNFLLQIGKGRHQKNSFLQGEASKKFELKAKIFYCQV